MGNEKILNNLIEIKNKLETNRITEVEAIKDTLIVLETEIDKLNFDNCTNYFKIRRTYYECKKLLKYKFNIDLMEPVGIGSKGVINMVIPSILRTIDNPKMDATNIDSIKRWLNLTEDYDVTIWEQFWDICLEWEHRINE